MRVCGQGDPANRAIPGEDGHGDRRCDGPGAPRPYGHLVMARTAKDGSPKILTGCVLPLAGKRRVNRVTTGLGVPDITDEGLVLAGCAPGVGVEWPEFSCRTANTSATRGAAPSPSGTPSAPPAGVQAIGQGQGGISDMQVGGARGAVGDPGHLHPAHRGGKEPAMALFGPHPCDSVRPGHGRAPLLEAGPGVELVLHEQPLELAPGRGQLVF